MYPDEYKKEIENIKESMYDYQRQGYLGTEDDIIIMIFEKVLDLIEKVVEDCIEEEGY